MKCFIVTFTTRREKVSACEQAIARVRTVKQTEDWTLIQYNGSEWTDSGEDNLPLLHRVLTQHFWVSNRPPCLLCHHYAGPNLSPHLCFKMEQNKFPPLGAQYFSEDGWKDKGLFWSSKPTAYWTVSAARFVHIVEKDNRRNTTTQWRATMFNDTPLIRSKRPFRQMVSFPSEWLFVVPSLRKWSNLNTNTAGPKFGLIHVIHECWHCIMSLNFEWTQVGYGLKMKAWSLYFRWSRTAI